MAQFRSAAQTWAEKQAFLLPSWGGHEYSLAPAGSGVGLQAGYDHTLGLVPLPYAGVDVGTPHTGLSLSGPLPRIGLRHGLYTRPPGAASNPGAGKSLWGWLAQQGKSKADVADEDRVNSMARFRNIDPQDIAREMSTFNQWKNKPQSWRQDVANELVTTGKRYNQSDDNDAGDKKKKEKEAGMKQAVHTPPSQAALNTLYAAGGAGRGATYGALLGALGGGAYGAYDPGGYVGLDKGGNPVLKRRSRLMGALQNILPGLRTGAVAGGLAGAGYGYAMAPSSDQVSISPPSPPPGPVLKKASARAFGAKVAFKLSPEIMQGGLGGAALGAGIGGLAGLISPGEDENGRKRNRLSAALSGALGGAGIGGLGGAAVGGFSPDTVRNLSSQFGRMFRPAPTPTAPAPGQAPMRNPMKSPADYAQPGVPTSANNVMGKMQQDSLGLDTTQLPAGSAYSRLSDAPQQLPAVSFGQEIAKLKQLPQAGPATSPLSSAPAYTPRQTPRQLPFQLSQATGEEPMASLYGQQVGGAAGSSVSNLEMQRQGAKAREMMAARQNAQAQQAAAEQAAARNAAFQQRIRTLYPGISEEEVNNALASGLIR